MSICDIYISTFAQGSLGRKSPLLWAERGGRSCRPSPLSPPNLSPSPPPLSARRCAHSGGASQRRREESLSLPHFGRASIGVWGAEPTENSPLKTVQSGPRRTFLRFLGWNTQFPAWARFRRAIFMSCNNLLQSRFYCLIVFDLLYIMFYLYICAFTKIVV